MATVVTTFELARRLLTGSPSRQGLHMGIRSPFILAAICLLAGIQARAQNDVFVEPPQYAAPCCATAIAVGDFNGDGKLDLAVVNNNDPGIVSILLGNGDGTFQTHVDYGVGSGPSSVMVADFNGDSKLDLAITNQGSNSVSVLFGNGDGTFQARADYGTGSSPVAVAVGDFDGNGKPDMAVVNAYGSSVSIFLNSGSGTFPSRQDFATGFLPYSVAVGDFNKDGHLDLATVECGKSSNCAPDTGVGSVSILLGNGDGTFQAHVDSDVGVQPVSVTAADLDGDGFVDLIVANHGGSPGDLPAGGNVTVLWGNGTGTFATQNFTAGNQPSSIEVGDFNADGQLDFAVTNQSDEMISIFINQGNRSFAQPSVFYGAGGFAWSAVSGDFNGDQKLDLAVVCGTGLGNGVCMLLGDGNAGFSQTPISFPTGNGPDYVAVGDFNGDGKNDAVVANFLDNDVSVFLGDGNGSFQPQVKYNTGTGPTWVATGDLRHGGHLDLVVANQTANTVSVLLNNGDGTYQTHVDYPTANGPSSLAIGDLNGDGKLDLAAACSASNTVSILMGNGDGSFQAHSDLGVGLSPQGITMGDFNGDGKVDLAVVNSGDSTISILINNGNGTFGGPAPIVLQSSRFYQYTSIATADLNGDGKLDLVVGGFRAELAVLLGNGDGTFQLPVYYAGGSSIAIADFNGDGFPDVATASDTGAILSLGNGDGTFQPSTQFPTGNSFLDSGSVAVGDFNGDGKPDLLVANGSSSGGSDTLTVLLNKGRRTASFELSASPGSQTVAAGNSASFTVTATTSNGFNSAVTLTCTGQPSGSTCSASPASITPTLSGTTSTLMVSTSSSTNPGTYTLTITGTSGTEQFSVQPSLTVNVTPDFSVSAPSSTTPSSVMPGQSATAEVTVGSTDGFVGMVSFTCSVSPASALAPTCSMSPAQAQVTGGGQAQSMLTVKTTGQMASVRDPNLGHGFGPIYAIVFPVLGVALAGIRLKSGRRKNHLLGLAICCMLLQGLMLQLACGGSSPSVAKGTPAGSYTIAITASSGSTQHGSSIALSVQ